MSETGSAGLPSRLNTPANLFLEELSGSVFPFLRGNAIIEGIIHLISDVLRTVSGKVPSCETWSLDWTVILSLRHFSMSSSQGLKAHSTEGLQLRPRKYNSQISFTVRPSAGQVQSSCEGSSHHKHLEGEKQSSSTLAVHAFAL